MAMTNARTATVSSVIQVLSDDLRAFGRCAWAETAADEAAGIDSSNSLSWLPRSLGKIVPASCQSRQPSRQTSESELTRPSLSQVRIKSPGAGQTALPTAAECTRSFPGPRRWRPASLLYFRQQNQERQWGRT